MTSFAHNLNLDDTAMSNVLHSARNIAVVGHSDNPGRTSYQIARFLRQAGYNVYPVNPYVQQIDGEPCYASLADVPVPIDIVNVFRRSEFLAGVVEEAIAVKAQVVWAQLGVEDAAAMQRALDAGLAMAMDRCIKVEYWRLGINHAKQA
jgi:predicted CoA-binding protein